MIDAPWFEDLEIGDDLSDVPAVTLTSGHAAVHQMIFGDRMRLPLDHTLSLAVTGVEQPIVNPSLVCNMAIGQSTIPTQRVLGNLFYRGLVLRQPVYLGDTLRTSTRVVALRQNRIKPGRPASGMVVLEIDVRNQRDESVMHLWRCPMVPCRDPQADTGRNDSFDHIPERVSDQEMATLVPQWNYAAFVQAAPGKHFEAYQPGDRFEIQARDTVTLAPELVRMTLNLAMTHTDAAMSVYGKRLVYGGHTISIAAAQMVRALPNLLGIPGWFRCDHVAPVFESDILRSVVSVTDVTPLDGCGMLALKVEVFAERGPDAPESATDGQVLAWELAGLLAAGG
jgi:2-methylfumaryl-CoA hydratase